MTPPELRTAGCKADDDGKAHATTHCYGIPSAEPCPALENDGYAQWTAGTPGVPKTGTCITGYAGNPQRLCDSNGWQPITQGACERTCERSMLVALRLLCPDERAPCEPLHRIVWAIAITCNGDEFNNVVFPDAVAGQTNVKGSCKEGYAGAPTRNCMNDGTFSDENGDSTPCTRMLVKLWQIADAHNLLAHRYVAGASCLDATSDHLRHH